MKYFLFVPFSVSFLVASCGIGSKSSGGNSGNSDLDGSISVKQLSAGTNYICGITLNGNAKCLGENDYGQLGNGTNSQALNSVSVSNLSNVTMVSSSLFNTCFVANGNAYCSGYNRYGQLGNGSTTDSSTPVQINSITNISQISTGSNGYTCALNSSGTAYCWGALADHSNPSSYKDSPIPIQLNTQIKFKNISVGGANACAVSLDGIVYCWQSIDNSPNQIAGINNIQFVSTSGIGSCALNSLGTTYCWGDNRYGQLGNGSTNNSSTPVQVLNINNFNSIYATGLNTCGTTTDKKTYCWGLGQSGQLGNGSTNNSTTPVQINTSESFSQVSGSQYAFFGVNQNGRVFAWGAWKLDGVTPTINLTPAQINF